MSFTRRQFLSAGALAGLSLAQNEASRPSIFCAFVKFVQDLPDREMARELARLGYLGIEATIRRKGQVEPTEVEDGLPKLVEALQAEELEITIMASDVNRADDLVMEKTLRVAAALGVKRYRMAYYRYDFAKPLRTQLDNLRPQVRELTLVYVRVLTEQEGGDGVLEERVPYGLQPLEVDGIVGIGTVYSGTIQEESKNVVVLSVDIGEVFV